MFHDKKPRCPLIHPLVGGLLLLFALPHAGAQQSRPPKPLAVLLPPTQQGEPDSQPLAISLDTVLRLAQDQNGQVAIARQRLQEAYAQQDLAAKKWIPDLTIGTAYYRHEGGIQDFEGQLIHSSYGSLFAGLEMRGKLDLRETGYQRIDADAQGLATKRRRSASLRAKRCSMRPAPISMFSLPAAALSSRWKAKSDLPIWPRSRKHSPRSIPACAWNWYA